MLFMTIFTWEPEKRDEVFKRREVEEIPEGYKVIGEWVDISGGQVFRLFDVDDTKVIPAVTFAWNDLGKPEIVPVMETEELMKLMPKGQKFL